MKRLTVVLVALLQASLSLVGQASAGSTIRATCRQMQSRGCVGLAAFYKFEEGSDYIRRDSYGFADLIEPDGLNVNNTASGKFGNALSLGGLGANYVHVRDAPALGNTSWTITAWLLPSSNCVGSGSTTIFQKDFGANYRGTNLGFKCTSGVIYPSAEVWLDETGTSQTLTSTTSISTSWSLVIWSYRPWIPSRNGQLMISVNGAAFQTASVAGPIRTSATSFIVGAYGGGDWGSNTYSGRLDHVGFYGTYWADDDAAWAYNGGSGRDFPFTQ